MKRKRRIMRRITRTAGRFVCFVMLAGLLAAAGTATADTHTWTGGGGDDNWSTGANWGGTAPVAGDSLVFAGTTRLTPVNNFDADTSFASITFNSGAGAFTITGNRIALTGDIVNNDDSLQTLNTAIVLSGATRTVNAASGNITLGGEISGSQGLTKTGDGALTLSGNNSYDGVTTINAGKIKIGYEGESGWGPLGGTNNGTVVAAGAALDLNGIAMQPKELLTLNGTGIAGGGALMNSSATGVCYNGAITLGSAASIVSSSGNIAIGAIGGVNTAGFGLTFGGTVTGNGCTYTSISGAGSVTKEGTGTWTCTGGSTYTGATMVNQGRLRSTDVSSGYVFGNAGTSAVTVAAGATVDLAGGESQVVGSLTGGGNVELGSVTITIGANNTSPPAFSGIISGTGSVTKNGTGTLTLSGTNSYSGATTVSTGIVVAANNNAFGTTAGGVFVGGTAQVQLTGNITVGEENLELQHEGIGLCSVSGSNTWGGALPFVNNSIKIKADSGSTLTFSYTGNQFSTGGRGVTFVGAGDIVVNGVIIDPVIKGSSAGDTGTLTLTGASTYSGGTTVSNGTLRVNNTSGSGTGSGGVAVGGAGAFGTPTLTGTGTISGAVAVSGTDTAGTISGTNGYTLTLSGGLTLSSGSKSSFNLSGAPGSAPVAVTGGTLTAGGNTITIPTANQAGTYNVISYTSTLLSSGFSIAGSGNAPGYSYAVDYADGATKYINVVVTATAPPTFVSATTTADGTKVTVTFSKAMANPAGTEAQFTVLVNGSGDTVTAAALNADTTKIDLTLTSVVHAGDTVTVAYTAGTVTAADSGILATFGAQSVTNASTVQYTVTFNKNGGDTEANPTTRSANYNATVTLPTPPTRTGYAFNGWNTQAGGGGSTFTASTPVVAGITVYAQWSAPVRLVAVAELQENTAGPIGTAKAPAAVYPPIAFGITADYLDGDLFQIDPSNGLLTKKNATTTAVGTVYYVELTATDSDTPPGTDQMLVKINVISSASSATVFMFR